MLKVKQIIFQNPETGKEHVVNLPEGYQLELNAPFTDDEHSADFLAGMILAGAYKTISDSFKRK